jgi:hypothetical protein
VGTSARPQVVAASFGCVTVLVSDNYFMAVPAEAVIVSANSTPADSDGRRA